MLLIWVVPGVETDRGVTSSVSTRRDLLIILKFAYWASKSLLLTVEFVIGVVRYGWSNSIKFRWNTYIIPCVCLIGTSFLYCFDFEFILSYCVCEGWIHGDTIYFYGSCLCFCCILNFLCQHFPFISVWGGCFLN